MNSDLIKRLRAKEDAHLPGGYKLCGEAADALEQMERDFKEYIGRVHSQAEVYACRYCKHGYLERGVPSCQHDKCDGVKDWDWGNPDE